MIKTVMSEATRLYDLPQVPMIKTVMSEVTRLYDLHQVLMIKTAMSEVPRYRKLEFGHIRTVLRSLYVKELL